MQKGSRKRSPGSPSRSSSRERSPQRDELKRQVNSRRWGPGCFANALNPAQDAGIVTRVGRGTFALAGDGNGRSGVPFVTGKRNAQNIARFEDMRVFRRSDGRRSAAEAVAQLKAASSAQLRERASRARRRAFLLAPLVVGVVLVNKYRMSLFGLDEPIRLACALALVGLGAVFARDFGRAIGPGMAGRMDQGTAGTLGFIMRFVLLIAAVLLALRIAGLAPQTLAVGGAVTAIVLGLAAQSTIGNVFAGLLILSVQPFRVGERVRLQAGALAGVIEGTVTQLGLLYVTLANGDDVILVPNNAVVTSAIVPLRQPGSVDLLARLRPGIRPSEVQRLIEETVQVPTRDHPEIHLEEVDDDEVVMRITATPLSDSDGPQLADEVLAAVDAATKATNGSH